MTEKQRSLIGGISILGLAGIICKLVGVLYRIPLANMIGGEGLGLYQQVFPSYNLMLTVTSAGIPVAISRLVSHYTTLKEEREADKVFLCALRLLFVLGVVTTALFLLLSRSIAAWVGTPEGYLSYMCIAPSLFFVCVMSAFRGYMQGKRHMMPTAVSQLIEQVGKVAVALPMAQAGFARGGWPMGAAGALLGTSIAEGVAMLYMIVICRRDMKGILRARRPDGGISSRQMTASIVVVAIPITLGACIVPLASFIDSAMLKNLMAGTGMTDSEARIRYGMYSGMVLTMINVPTALAMAMSTNLVPDIASGMARKDMDYVAAETATGLRIAAVIGFPCSVGMSVLAKPVLFLCYGSSSYTREQLMLTGSLLEISAMTIILFTMVQATSGILQGAGKQKIPMITLVCGVACKITLNYFLVSNPNVNIYGAPVASLVCYTVSMVPNLWYSCKYTSCRFSVKEVVLRPGAAALLMGAAVLALYRGAFGGEEALRMHSFGSTFVTTAVCIAAGFAVYLFAAWKLKAVRREDLPARVQRLFKRRRQGQR